MKIPKMYQNKIDRIEREGGLIDDCKFMVYLKDGVEHKVFGNSFAIKNAKELKEFMNDID